ncbi:hypothetical protein JCM3775_001245 [Rhodotorula graminis]|uniref:Uncharacterized protein n=1 Tax=Rhodotorula graminis (strain WP1) TaxID=578459 RepID=A0A194S2G7_RHOGW|nr:uncharacterized protein RHOBADRAFT_44234 [Rhodotorula graminis WP1]KPV74714.1 hypothetical protein RHOBADRAFT_44234 [Rhodotorula graminis WP1]
MSYMPYDWPTSAKDAVPCNATLVALVESAVGLTVQQISFEQCVAAVNCQYTSTNSTLKSEARHVWEVANAFGYTPSAIFAIVAILIFAVSSSFHLYQTIKSRRWWCLAVVLGGALQVFGWVERYMASQNLRVGYVIQLAVLTIAPTFFSAAIYALFGMTAAVQDASLLPRWTPRAYFKTFTIVDFVTLLVQAAGGALAATVDGNTPFEIGCNIMLAGIILQLVTTVVFLVVFGLYFRRLALVHPDRHVLRLKSRTGLVFWGTLVMAALILVRGGFRTAELAEGLYSGLSRTQTAIILLDAVPMMTVILLLNVTHPLYTVDPLVNRYRSTPTDERGSPIQLGLMSRIESADKWQGASSRVDRSSV